MDVRSIIATYEQTPAYTHSNYHIDGEVPKALIIDIHLLYLL